MPERFKTLAETAQKIAGTRGSYGKIDLCAGYLKQIESETDLELAVQFLAEGAFPSASGRRASVGSLTSSTCAAAFCEIDYEKVFKPCRTFIGNTAETIGLLMANTDAARSKRSPASPSLKQVQVICEALSRASSRVNKQDILWETWTRMTPVEITYFLRIIDNGPLRIGLQVRSVMVAVARAFGRETDRVGYVQMITGSSGRTAVLARAGKLEEASFRLFQPISWMLASPGAPDPKEHGVYLAEEKFEGLRCQVHVSGMRVELYSRELEEVTGRFPEVVGFFAEHELPDLVLDGVLCAYRNGELQPFQLIQKRMERKSPSRETVDRIPVIFIAFDLLYRERPLFDETVEERGRLLGALAGEYGLAVANRFEADDRQTVERLYERAVARGNGGLILKRKGSRYAYGQRGGDWLKMKKPGDSIEAVILYAHSGSKGRGGPWTDFTLGVRVREDERYEESYIPIGRITCEPEKEEAKRLHRSVKELITDRYGPTMGLKPGIVVELEFEGVEVNRRTKANLTLRNPQFRSIRWDLRPSDANTLADLERLMEEKLHRVRLKQEGEDPSFRFG